MKRGLGYLLVAVLLAPVFVVADTSAEPASLSPSGSRGIGTSGEGAGESVSLEEAVALAIDGHPRMRMSRAGKAMAVSGLSGAKTTWFPTVSVSETYAHGDNPVFVFASLLEQGRFGPENFDPIGLNDPDPIDNYRFLAELNYPIFDQLRRFSSVQQAREGVKGASARVDLTEQEIRYQVIRAYYGVRLAESGRDVATKAVETAESGVSSIRDRFEVGLVVESDLLAAEVQLAEFRQKLVTAEGEVAVARAGLNSLLGFLPSARLTLTGDLRAADFPVAGLDAYIEEARASHPRVVEREAAARTASLELRKAKGSFLPRVDGFANIGVSGASFDEHSTDRTWGVRVSLNLFEPGRMARLGQARAMTEIAEAEREDNVREIELGVVTAWQRLRAASQRVELASTSVAQAREAMRIIRDRYQEGLTTITEELRAQTAVVQAETGLLSARYDYYVGYADLLRATGRLNDVGMFQ